MSRRKNYYDDVIDYLDHRQKGLYREPPRAQEWAERAMRTYDQKNIDKSIKRSADIKHITKMVVTPRHYSYHTRAYYSLKYQRILWVIIFDGESIDEDRRLTILDCSSLILLLSIMPVVSCVNPFFFFLIGLPIRRKMNIRLKNEDAVF